MDSATYSNIGSGSTVNGNFSIGKVDLTGMPLILDAIAEIINQIEGVSMAVRSGTGLGVISDQLEDVSSKLAQIANHSPVVNVAANIPEIIIPAAQIVNSMPSEVKVTLGAWIYAILGIIAVTSFASALCLIILLSP